MEITVVYFVSLPDRFRELYVLLLCLLQVSVFLLHLLFFVHYLNLQASTGSFQLLLQNRHLRTNETSAGRC